MGKKEGPTDFAHRGISRVLAPQVSEDVERAVRTAVGHGSPLRFSPVAKRTLCNVCEIYAARGFLGPSENELQTLTEGGSWDLTWVDMQHGKWISASFIIHTSTGPWRVVMQQHNCHIVGAFPVLDAGNAPTSAQGSPAPESLSVKCWTATQLEEEKHRLLGLGVSLRAMQKELGYFLYCWCPTSKQSRVRKFCEELQQQCKEDHPSLHDGLWWEHGESWSAWANRISVLVEDACNIEDCILPVRAVHFTHAAISATFRHGAAAGSDLESLVEDLRLGRVNPLVDKDLVLEAVRYNGKVHSLNNRRLWALQQHQLLALTGDVEVQIRVKVLPWSNEGTVGRFLKAYDTKTHGDAVRCRTKLPGGPTDGVVATTLGRAVLATRESAIAEAKRESSMFEQQRQQSTCLVWDAHNNRNPSADDKKQLCATDLQLGDESFADWREAKVRVQSILRQRSGGKPVPEAELRLLLDVFRFHPKAGQKRVGDVVSVTVGSSEKFAGTPAFWLWRHDGSGEDISMNKCYARMDAAAKVTAKPEAKAAKREVVAGGKRFHGHLGAWQVEKGNKSYGYIHLEGSDEEVYQICVKGQAGEVFAAQGLIFEALRKDAAIAGHLDPGVSITMHVQSKCAMAERIKTDILQLKKTGSDVTLLVKRGESLHCRLDGSMECVISTEASILELIQHAQGACSDSAVHDGDDGKLKSEELQLQIAVPDDMVSHFRAEQGAAIKEIQSKTGCFLRLARPPLYIEGGIQLTYSQKLYLAWDDVAPDSQKRAEINPCQAFMGVPFKPGTLFSFRVFRWLGNGKFGCEDAQIR
ncbi:unnamed protein product [Polarella glacialis]|uniref:Uncharacterized protein n=1 Tax=Polarella glacialis TaxID=89957 RepID=A0A813K9R1_POLGL|nr:unnamed protein product [Polarella glacialis]